MEFVKCNLCGGQDYKRLFFGRDHLLPTEEKFQVVKCSQCGLVFLNPRPDAYEIEHYYPREFFYNPNTQKETELWLKKCIEVVGRIKKGKRILDIGCGTGKLIYEMQSRGWEVFGVDTSAIASSYTKEKLGIKNIYNQDLLDVNLPEHYFDIITLWHVIEHLSDPLGTLKRINLLLKEDGVLIIDCPNFNSLARIIFREKWFPLFLPRHFYQFTPQILKRMLEIGGFMIEEINYMIFPTANMALLKVSFIQWLGLDRPLETTSDGTVGIKKRPFLWILFREFLNLGCFIISMILALLHRGDDIYILAKKYNKQKIESSLI
jgi:SAM-dependent methyltransferase